MHILYFLFFLNYPAGHKHPTLDGSKEVTLLFYQGEMRISKHEMIILFKYPSINESKGLKVNHVHRIFTSNRCAANFSFAQLAKRKSLGRSKPATNSQAQALQHTVWNVSTISKPY